MNGDRVILAGGSGFIGGLLARRLAEQGAEVVVLRRRTDSQMGRFRQVQWDGRTVGDWADDVNGSLAVVNLAGRNVNCRHTAENRREIVESRVNSVKALADAVGRCTKPPSVFVQSAGIAIYGEFGEGCCDESFPPGEGFLVDTCLRWEGAFNEAALPGVRRVLLRIGVVLGTDGGAFPMLGKITRWGLGGAVGTGKQAVNWIHATDLANVILAAIRDQKIRGIYNACGPNPVTNSEFMRELRHALRRPWSPPAPALAVRVGAWLMGSDARLALTGRCCIPKHLLDQGFKFEFPHLPAALADLSGK